MDDRGFRVASTADAAELTAVYRNAYRENRRPGVPAKAESATAKVVVEKQAD